MFVTPRKPKDNHRVASAESGGRGGGGKGDGGRGRGDGGRGKGRGGGNPQRKGGPGLPGRITLKNYTNDEYEKMSQAQRDELRMLRQADISRREQQARGSSSGGRRDSRGNRGRDDPGYDRHINAIVEERVAAALNQSREQSRERSRDRDHDDAPSSSGRRSRDREVRSDDDNRSNPATNRSSDSWGRQRRH